MEEKQVSFSFAPSRWKGILFLSAACGALIFLELWLLRRFNVSQVGLQFFLLLIALIIFAVPLLFLLYRFYSLIFSVYRLERDGLHINWGLRREVIPLNAIEWIRSPAEMTEDVPWSVLPMPGAYLGTVETDEHSAFEFLASDMSRMLFLRTSRFIYVISPRNPAAFLNGFERILQMGALTNVQWTTTRPGSWILEAWSSRTARISGGLSILFLAVLYIWVGVRFQVMKQISFSFSPTGEPLEQLPSVNMLVIPLAATIIWILGTVLGLLLFQKREGRRTAELVWGGVSAAVLQFLIAAFMNY